MRGVETEWQRLGDVLRGLETISRGMEVINSAHQETSKVISRGSWRPCTPALAPLLIFNFQNFPAGKLYIQK